VCDGRSGAQTQSRSFIGEEHKKIEKHLLQKNKQGHDNGYSLIVIGYLTVFEIC